MTSKTLGRKKGSIHHDMIGLRKLVGLCCREHKRTYVAQRFMWRPLWDTHGDGPFRADMRHINRRDDVRKNVRLWRILILLQVGLDSTNSADPPFGAFQRKRFSFAS
jgi:hypothetical protein